MICLTPKPNQRFFVYRMIETHLKANAIILNVKEALT